MGREKSRIGKRGRVQDEKREEKCLCSCDVSPQRKGGWFSNFFHYSIDESPSPVDLLRIFNSSSSFPRPIVWRLLSFSFASWRNDEWQSGYPRPPRPILTHPSAPMPSSCNSHPSCSVRFVSFLSLPRAVYTVLRGCNKGRVQALRAPQREDG